MEILRFLLRLGEISLQVVVDAFRLFFFISSLFLIMRLESISSVSDAVELLVYIRDSYIDNLHFVLFIFGFMRGVNSNVILNVSHIKHTNGSYCMKPADNVPKKI